MTYYFDSRMPVCSYEWRHERKTINTKRLSQNKRFILKNMCFFLCKNGTATKKKKIFAAALHPTFSCSKDMQGVNSSVQTSNSRMW